MKMECIGQSIIKYVIGILKTYINSEPKIDDQP